MHIYIHIYNIHIYIHIIYISSTHTHTHTHTHTSTGPAWRRQMLDAPCAPSLLRAHIYTYIALYTYIDTHTHMDLLCVCRCSMLPLLLRCCVLLLHRHHLSCLPCLNILGRMRSFVG